MNIAIVSTNKDKYSETFIHNHVKLFEGTVHFLFNGYLPRMYSKDRGKTTFSLSAFGKNSIKHFFSKKKEEHAELITGIENYLRKNKMDVIFCEYGPAGVEMMEFSRKLNIPLIVHFHGYDAYRKDILESYGKKYAELFKVASSVVAVSSHMRNQLMALGCAERKLHLIPYGVNSEIFCNNKNNNKALTFVSCGRFVKKKAPHLLIKAFEVLSQQFTEAKLVMIGDGELLEDCKQLVQSLGLAEKVRFTGSLHQERIAEIYETAFAFVQHSVTTEENDSEGTPLAIIESGLSGLPVISTVHGGIPGVVTEGKTGFLVKENDWQDMAEKMIWLAAHPQKAFEMGQEAATRLRPFNLRHYTQQLMNLIENAAAKIS